MTAICPGEDELMNSWLADEVQMKINLLEKSLGRATVHAKLKYNTLSKTIILLTDIS